MTPDPVRECDVVDDAQAEARFEAIFWSGPRVQWHVYLAVLAACLEKWL
jgi:hypothetical protein